MMPWIVNKQALFISCWKNSLNLSYAFWLPPRRREIARLMVSYFTASVILFLVEEMIFPITLTMPRSQS